MACRIESGIRSLTRPYALVRRYLPWNLQPVRSTSAALFSPYKAWTVLSIAFQLVVECGKSMIECGCAPSQFEAVMNEEYSGTVESLMLEALSSYSLKALSVIKFLISIDIRWYSISQFTKSLFRGEELAATTRLAIKPRAQRARFDCFCHFVFRISAASPFLVVVVAALD